MTAEAEWTTALNDHPVREACNAVQRVEELLAALKFEDDQSDAAQAAFAAERRLPSVWATCAWSPVPIYVVEQLAKAYRELSSCRIGELTSEQASTVRLILTYLTDAIEALGLTWDSPEDA